MNISLPHPESALLSNGPDDLILIAGTRVPLDTVAEVFRDGGTPEEIALGYPSLTLANVYSTIGYILGHETEVAAYLEKPTAHKTAVRQENERRFPSAGAH